MQPTHLAGDNLGSLRHVAFLSHVTCKVMPGRHDTGHIIDHGGASHDLGNFPSSQLSERTEEHSLRDPEVTELQEPGTGRARYGVEARGKGLQATEPVYC